MSALPLAMAGEVSVQSRVDETQTCQIRLSAVVPLRPSVVAPEGQGSSFVRHARAVRKPPSWPLNPPPLPKRHWEPVFKTLFGTT